MGAWERRWQEVADRLRADNADAVGAPPAAAGSLGELLTTPLVGLLDHPDQAVAAAAEELVSALERWQSRAHLYAQRDALRARLATVEDQLAFEEQMLAAEAEAA